MNWHTTTYRLPPESKPGKCQRPISDAQPSPCPEQATCAFKSILIGDGSSRYTERCDACSVLLAERSKIKPPGMREALIFPIPAGADAARCMSCKAEVRWIYTDKGKRMPVDPNGVSHFVTCPGGAAHRRS